MSTIVLDANPFLRLLLKDIPAQTEEFKKLLEQARNAKITLFVPQIVIFELNFTLEKYYLFEKEEIIKRLKPIIQAQYLQVQDRSIFIDALNVYEENAISFADSFVLSCALQKKGKLFTYDKKLKKLA